MLLQLFVIFTPNRTFPEQTQFYRHQAEGFNVTFLNALTKQDFFKRSLAFNSLNPV